MEIMRIISGGFRSGSEWAFVGLLWNPGYHLFLWENVLILSNHVQKFRIKLLSWWHLLSILKNSRTMPFFMIKPICLFGFIRYVQNTCHNCGGSLTKISFSVLRSETVYCYCLLFIFIWPFSNCQLSSIHSSIHLTTSSLKIRERSSWQHSDILVSM